MIFSRFLELRMDPGVQWVHLLLGSIPSGVDYSGLMVLFSLPGRSIGLGLGMSVTDSRPSGTHCAAANTHTSLPVVGFLKALVTSSLAYTLQASDDSLHT